jgi:hypothetical protein
MVASVFHLRIGAAASPSERVRAVFIKPGFVPSVFHFKLPLEVVRFLRKTATPPKSFSRRGPGDKLELPIVLAPVFTFPVTIVPEETDFRSTGPFVSFPVYLLAFPSYR